MKVLVVDDEEAILTVLSESLDLLGHEAVSCSNGSDCVELFKLRSNEIDAAILDISLPGISGVEALQELLKIKPNLPVYMSSGRPDSPEVQESIKRGAKGFMAKPFRIRELCQHLDDIAQRLDT